MFKKTIKNFQTRTHSDNWQKILRNKEITKNNYRANGDIKKAKAFVSLVSQYSFLTRKENPHEQLIYSRDFI